ncbi:hypothetical protein [Simiduia litorea]
MPVGIENLVGGRKLVLKINGDWLVPAADEGEILSAKNMEKTKRK